MLCYNEENYMEEITSLDTTFAPAAKYWLVSPVYDGGSKKINKECLLI